MWFIFPQLRGLGHFAMAEFYGIGSLNEARAYLAHGLLGPRLILCTETVLALQGRSLHAIFGSPDDMKFCSSMTLFAIATGEGEAVFRRALDHYCEGRLDERTVHFAKRARDRVTPALAGQRSPRWRLLAFHFQRKRAGSHGASPHPA